MLCEAALVGVNTDIDEAPSGTSYPIQPTRSGEWVEISSRTRASRNGSGERKGGWNGA